MIERAQIHDNINVFKLLKESEPNIMCIVNTHSCIVRGVADRKAPQLPTHQLLKVLMGAQPETPDMRFRFNWR